MQTATENLPAGTTQSDVSAPPERVFKFEDLPPRLQKEIYDDFYATHAEELFIDLMRGHGSCWWERKAPAFVAKAIERMQSHGRLEGVRTAEDDHDPEPFPFDRQ